MDINQVFKTLDEYLDNLKNGIQEMQDEIDNLKQKIYEQEEEIVELEDQVDTLRRR